MRILQRLQHEWCRLENTINCEYRISENHGKTEKNITVWMSKVGKIIHNFKMTSSWRMHETIERILQDSISGKLRVIDELRNNTCINSTRLFFKSKKWIYFTVWIQSSESEFWNEIWSDWLINCDSDIRNMKYEWESFWESNNEIA